MHCWPLLIRYGGLQRAVRFFAAGANNAAHPGWRDGPSFSAGYLLVEVDANAVENADFVILYFAVFIIDEDIIRSKKVAAVHG